MNISSDAGGIDSNNFLDYIAKQFPSDLAKMTAIRDELVQRQGALSAVEDANKLRADADSYAATCKIEADEALITAKTKAVEAKAKKAEADDLLSSLNSQRTEFDVYVKAKEKELKSRENSVVSREDTLLEIEENLKTAQSRLVLDQADFDARVKAFQDKVNSLSV
jgi:hypothetical protein